METLKEAVVAGVKGERRMNKSTEDFLGSETNLYDTIMVDKCHCKFIKTQRTYNTESEL